MPHCIMLMVAKHFKDAVSQHQFPTHLKNWRQTATPAIKCAICGGNILTWPLAEVTFFKQCAKAIYDVHKPDIVN